MTLRWLTNGPDRRVPHFHVLDPGSLVPRREIEVEKTKVRITCECMLTHLTIGPPRATKIYTQEQLRGFGLVGYYEEWPDTQDERST